MKMPFSGLILEPGPAPAIEVRYAFEKAEPGGVCSICLEEIEGNAVETDCHHHFHSACLREALRRDVRCPFCRSEVVVLRGAYTGPAILFALHANVKTVWFPKYDRMAFCPADLATSLVDAQERGLIFADRGGVAQLTGLVPLAWTKSAAASPFYRHALARSLEALGIFR